MAPPKLMTQDNQTHRLLIRETHPMESSTDSINGRSLTDVSRSFFTHTFRRTKISRWQPATTWIMLAISERTPRFVLKSSLGLLYAKIFAPSLEWNLGATHP